MPRPAPSSTLPSTSLYQGLARRSPVSRGGSGGGIGRGLAGRRVGGGGEVAGRLRRRQLLFAPGEVLDGGLGLALRRVGPEELAVEHDRALAVAREALGLRPGEQEEGAGFDLV